MEIGEINSSSIPDKYVVFMVRAAQWKSMPATTHPQISNHSILTRLKLMQDQVEHNFLG